MRKTLSLAFVLALAGCDLSAEAEADRVCVLQQNVATIPGAPGFAIPDNPFIPAVPLTLDIGDVLPADLGDKGIEADVVAQELSLSGADLTGVESFIATLQPPSGSGLAAVTFRYTRPAGATGVTKITALPVEAVDLVDYLQNQNQITVGLRFVGQAPQTPWQASAETCASTRVKVDYLEAAGQ